MKQMINKIIALMTVFCAIITVLPSQEVNLFTTKAYASTGDLSSLKLKTSGGSNIKIYDNSNYKSKNEVADDEIEAETRYYAKTSSSKIKVAIKGVDEDKVRVFASDKDSAKGVKVGKTIDLSSTTNKVTVRVYESDPGSSVKYKDDDDVSCDYTIKVKYTGDENDNNDEEDDDYDDVYLKSITLSSGDISFSKKTSKYDVYVDTAVDEIKIKAKPDDDDYTVSIDGSEVDEDNDYKKTVSLNKGKNTIEIEVEDEDEDEYRIYTLYIYRGQTSGSTNTVGNNNISAGNNVSQYNPITSSPYVSTQPNYKPTNSRVNQWVVINGKWQYLDSLGKPVTSKWFLDSNSGKYYYFGADGNMATGWIYLSGKWYMLDNSGAMLTGWQYSGGKWYYLNPANGEMVTNSYVGSYKVDQQVH